MTISVCLVNREVSERRSDSFNLRASLLPSLLQPGIVNSALLFPACVELTSGTRNARDTEWNAQTCRCIEAKFARSFSPLDRHALHDLRAMILAQSAMISFQGSNSDLTPVEAGVKLGCGAHSRDL